MKIEKEDNSLVSKRYGVTEQKITGEQLEQLPESMLLHIKTLEKSMRNYYFIWTSAYPQLPLLSDPVQKAKVEASLRQEVLAMKNDLEKILKFIEKCGFQLDDHYLEIRNALENYK